MDCKVLTVSDGVIAGTRADASGNAVSDLLLSSGNVVIERDVTADGVDSVVEALTRLIEGFSGVVVTTGGTGFSPRDLTPEATESIVERRAPGLAEAMRSANPLGRLSRGVAGIVGSVIIVNLPGSPKGAVENLSAILDILPHAVELLSGDRSEHPKSSI